MFVSYDLAKAIQKDRLDRSIAERERRKIKSGPQVDHRQDPAGTVGDAQVVELVFPTSCETDQIGA